MKKTRMAALAAVALMAPTLVATSAGAQDSAPVADPNAPTYEITIRNINEGQWLTPPNVAIHDTSVNVWRRGHAATPGVQAVAENGAVPVLAAELSAALDQTGLGNSVVGSGGVEGPIPPGESRTFTLTSSEERLSAVAMLVCTNDGFAGLDSVRLPSRDGQTRTYRARAYDAGTEINTELHADLVPAPFCGGEGAGTGESNPELAENGVIARHRTIRGVGDLDGIFDWSGPVAEISVTRMNPTPSYTITFENVTEGQYFTPPNVAIHDRNVRVFQRGSHASNGVQQVAENGGVPVLAAELQAAVDDAGFGASTVGNTDEASGPIGPGQSRSFQLTADGNQFSLVSMLICTNDGFGGIDGNWFSLRNPGDSRTWNVRAYDVGTEINTELHADLVPAPFCGGEGAGTGESNPELAENGTISRHRTIRGVGDLGPEFDWKSAVARVTITRN